MSDILGISAFYHDSAACLVRDGVIVAAAQEERSPARSTILGSRLRRSVTVSRRRDPCQDLRYIAFYDKPLVKFERLLETYLSFAPVGSPPS